MIRQLSVLGACAISGKMQVADMYVSIRPVPVGLGTMCEVHDVDTLRTPPDFNARRTAPSYSVHDIGKSGVPALDRKQSRIVRTIEHGVHSGTLRFIILKKRLIVYDAQYGPCIGSAPGYRVLNGTCSEYYMPSSDQPDRTVVVPGGCFDQ